MVKFLLWLVLLVLCWPLALLALLLWPMFWMISLPFRIVGIVFDGVFAFLRAVVMLPARLIGGRSRLALAGMVPGFSRSLTMHRIIKSCSWAAMAVLASGLTGTAASVAATAPARGQPRHLQRR